MKELFESVWQKMGNVLLGGVALTAFFLIRLYNYARLYWTNEELLFFCTAPIILLIVLLSWGKNRGIDLPFLPSWAQVKARLTNEGADVSDFNWEEEMTAVYRPARRIPALPIGTDGKKFIEVAMKDQESHLTIVGMTGSGKSTLVNQIVLAAHNSGIYQVIAYSLKPGDLAPVEGLKNVHLVKYDNDWAGFASDFPLIIDSIFDEVQRRTARLSELKRANIWEMRADQRPPLLLIILEEMGVTLNRVTASMTNRERDDFLNKFGDVLRIGRSSGVHVLIANQDVANSVPLDILRNTVRIPFWMANGDDAYRATGRKNSGAETLRPNDADRGISPEVMIMSSKGDRRTAVPKVTKQDIARVIALSDQNGIPDHGRPTWLYGYKPPVNAPETISGQNEVVAHAEVGTAVTPQPAPAGVNVREVMAMVYADAKEAAKATPGRTDAYTDARFVGAWFGALAGDMSENEIMAMVFNGGNPRYRQFVKEVAGKAEEHYGQA